MATLPSRAFRTTNAHTLDVATTDDFRRHLAAMGADDAGDLADRFLHATVKLENVDTRAANALGEYVEALGGGIAVPREAGERTARETDVLVTGSRHTMGLLVRQLKHGPFGLDGIGDQIAACITAGNRIIRWGARSLDFTRKTYVMGILNCTPDSFYPASRSATLREAVRAADEMVRAGVDIVDVGGESTRPGADPVPLEEEIRRVVPVVEALRGAGDVMISVDTRNRATAEGALDAGADMVNDVSGLRHDDGLARLVAERGVPVVLMHMRGTPKTMQDHAVYRSIISEVLRELGPSIAAARAAGIAPEKIIVDPGVGFGKRIQDNLRIIRELGSLRSLGFPILIGVSRKSFIGELTGQPVEGRLVGTVTANTLAVLNGADIVRVHDVTEAVAMVRVIDAVRGLGA